MDKYLKSKNNTIEVIIMLVFSFAVLFFCTASSPFYGINPWVDSNAFFTVGKAMANGVTIYKDIFEQKGPFLYVIHALSYLISNTSFTGVYVFESISLFVAMLFTYKTAKLYLKKTLSLTSAILFAVTMVNATSFYIGDSAEEFSMPFLMILIYYTVYYFKDTENNRLKWYVYFINGVFAGCILMTKFTVIGFWFGFMAFVSLHTLFVKKDVKGAFKNAFIFLGGMALVLIGFSVYFLIKGGLKEFFETYFGFNLGVYSTVSTSIYFMVYGFLHRCKYWFLKNIIVGLISAFGCLTFVLCRNILEPKITSKISVLFVLLGGVFFIYIGGYAYAYYFLPFCAFTIFLYIYLGTKLEQFSSKTGYQVCVLLMASVVSLVMTLTVNTVFKNIPREKEETVQYQISSLINSRSENATVLCYNSLDVGAYLFDNIVPEYKYFEKQNVNYDEYPENMDEQNRYINEHLAEYVVTRVDIPDFEEDHLKKIYEENHTLENDYTLIFSQKVSVPNDTNRKDKIELYYVVFELNK